MSNEPMDITENVIESPIYDDLPEVIYHYCSAQSFYEIIQSNQLWFSNIRMSNDEYEQIAIYDLLEEVVKEFPESADLLGQVVLDASIDLETAYVACFSLSSSMLSLW